MSEPSSELGIGPKDWVPKDDGPPCDACPHGQYRHRREKHRSTDCLYCPCKRFTDKGLGL